jgi:hypothetical protein
MIKLRFTTALEKPEKVSEGGFYVGKTSQIVAVYSDRSNAIILKDSQTYNDLLTIHSTLHSGLAYASKPTESVVYFRRTNFIVFSLGDLAFCTLYQDRDEFGVFLVAIKLSLSLLVKMERKVEELAELGITLWKHVKLFKTIKEAYLDGNFDSK